MNKLFCTILFLSFTTSLWAHEEPQIDTVVNVDKIHVTTIKQGLNLYREPVSATVLSKKSLDREHVSAIKDVAQVVPNLHIPDYGSRMTSSIYVRGLGARIDQPVIGLNIDNVPYLNKNAFDLEVMDIERMEILRGPQSTLYGRNTMGGVINIYTLSPMSYQGVRIGAEYSSGNSYNLRASAFMKHSEKFGSSIGLYYGSSDGLFTNEATGKKCDSEQTLGGRMKLHFAPTTRIRIENTLAMSQVDQGGYPYRQLDTGLIIYNDPSSYTRTNISNGLTVKYIGEGYHIASITGYQYLDDKMTLDNDFTEKSYFILSQATQEHSITEDIVFRTDKSEGYNVLLGAFGFFKGQDMQAPVTFKDYGIKELILKNANKGLAPYYYVWNDSEFMLGSDFRNSTFGGALYHESSYEASRWKATVGIRFDYENATLDYRNFTNTSCTKYDEFDNLLRVKEINIDESDNTNLSFLEIIPKINILYRLGSYNQSSLYTSLTKGYKAGGFNTQMFSDILQQKVMSKFGVGEQYDVSKVITYKPEQSWNYEVGGHFESDNRRFISDVALFYIDCRNQQLTVFPEGQTTGRMMTNAGRSRSFGAELSLQTSITDNFGVNASYGYTNAKFTKYINGNSDYAGNYVPYAPQHTTYLEVNYNIPINSRCLKNIELSVNGKGAGKIYWNEDNSRYQPYYNLLNASILFEFKKVSLSIWGKNLTDKQYDVFYFKSIGNEFTQSGLPRTMGATVNINI